MLDTIYAQVSVGVTVLVCGFALLQGGWAERRAAALLLVSTAAVVVIQDQGAGDSIGLMGVDIVVLVGLGILAWASGRDWLIWATACQSIVVASHFAYIMDFQISLRAYMNALAMGFYVVLACLGVGTLLTWRERKALRLMSSDPSKR